MVLKNNNPNPHSPHRWSKG